MLRFEQPVVKSPAAVSGKATCKGADRLHDLRLLNPVAAPWRHTCFGAGGDDARPTPWPPGPL